MHRHPGQFVAAGFVLLVLLFAALQADAGVGATAQVKQLWNTQLGSGAGNAPYLDPSTNLLYVNTAQNFSILDASSGAVIKSVRTKSQDAKSDVVPVAGTMVCTNEFNYTTCLNKTTLATVWEFGVDGEFGTTPLYVSSQNAIFAANYNNTKMYKLNAKTGELQATSAKLPGQTIWYQRPAFSNKYNLVFCGDDSFVIALFADALNLAWKYATDSDVQTSGVLSEDESIIYFASEHGSAYALGTATGKLSWQFKFPVNSGTSNTPLLHNGVLYVGTDPDGLYFALNAATGKQIWTSVTSAKTEAYAGYSYVYGDTILYPSTNGVFALALNGSGIAWTWSGASAVWNFPAPTADGKLFLTDAGGRVYALQLPPASGTSKGVVEKRCLDTACSSQCRQGDFSANKCFQTGPTTSILRTCSTDGTKLFTKTFSQSSGCDLSSPRTDGEYRVGKCYLPAFGGSFEVTRCTA